MKTIIVTIRDEATGHHLGHTNHTTSHQYGNVFITGLKEQFRMMSRMGHTHLTFIDKDIRDPNRLSRLIRAIRATGQRVKIIALPKQRVIKVHYVEYYDDSCSDAVIKNDIVGLMENVPGFLDLGGLGDFFNRYELESDERDHLRRQINFMGEENVTDILVWCKPHLLFDIRAELLKNLDGDLELVTYPNEVIVGMRPVVGLVQPIVVYDKPTFEGIYDLARLRDALSTQGCVDLTNSDTVELSKEMMSGVSCALIRADQFKELTLELVILGIECKEPIIHEGQSFAKTSDLVLDSVGDYSCKPTSGGGCGGPICVLRDSAITLDGLSEDECKAALEDIRRGVKESTQRVSDGGVPPDVRRQQVRDLLSSTEGPITVCYLVEKLDVATKEPQAVTITLSSVDTPTLRVNGEVREVKPICQYYVTDVVEEYDPEEAVVLIKGNELGDRLHITSSSGELAALHHDMLLAK